MKKSIIIISIIVFVFLAVLVAIPVVFKGALLEKTKTTIKKQLGVEVGFTDFSLSLFKNFPKASLEMKDAFVTGVNQFQDDTLLTVSDFSTEMSLKSLFSKDGAKIDKLVLKSPVLKLLVAEDGKTNWDFSKDVPESKAVKEDSENEKIFQLGLEDVKISNADVSYVDQSSGVKIYFLGADINLSGKMFGSSTDLNTWAKVNQFRLQYDSLTYVSNATLETNSVLTIDYEKMKFDIKENELLVNSLPLVLKGNVTVPNDSVLFNLDIQSTKSGLDEFLALVPPDSKKYLDGLTARGNATMEGKVKGFYVDNEYPEFSFDFKIDEGNLKYADLPEDVKNITANLSLQKPQGKLELMELKISQAHTEIKNNPVDLTLSVSDLFGDPYFDGGLVGKINFDHLKDALPLDSVNIAGEVDANVFVKAPYSAILNEQYNKINSDGIVYLSGFSYADPDFTQTIYIPNGQLNFSPAFVQLSEMDVKIGHSDMRLSGKVSNYLGYFLSNGILSGNLSLISRYLNLNELVNLKVKNEEKVQVEQTKPEEPGLVAVSIPENLNLVFTSKVENAYFGGLPLNGIDGLITAKNGKLQLEGLKWDMFGGIVTLTGSYENNTENKPLIDFGFDMNSLDLPLASRTLTGLQKIMPTASKSKGKISTRFTMKGQVDEHLSVVSSSVNGNGSFNSKDIQFIDSPTFNQLKNVLKQEKLKNVTIDNFTAHFNIENGNLLLKPFQTKIAGQPTTIEGSLNVDDIINLKMNFVVERSAFGPDIEEILGVLPGQEKITNVPVTVLVSGPVNNPEVKMDYTETRKYITEKIAESASDGLKKIGNALKKLIK